MRALALLLLVAAAAPAQLQVVCGPLPTEYSKTIFDRRTARYVQAWSCVATNPGSSSAVASEAEMMSFLLRNGVTALSTEAIRVGAPEIKRRGKWATAGRMLQRAGTLTAVLAAGEIISIGPAWGAAAGFAALQLPQWGEALAARDPDDGNFERLAMGPGGLTVDAGRSVSMTMFAAPRKDATAIQGEIGFSPQQVIDSIDGSPSISWSDAMWRAKCE